MISYPRFVCQHCGWAGNGPNLVFRATGLRLDGRLDGFNIPVCPVCNEEVVDRYACNPFG